LVVKMPKKITARKMRLDPKEIENQLDILTP
jgi:hypothetical protein